MKTATPKKAALDAAVAAAGVQAPMIQMNSATLTIPDVHGKVHRIEVSGATLKDLHMELDDVA